MQIFLDTFELLNSSGNSINIITKGITWPNEIGKKFKQTDKSKEIQWINPEDGFSKNNEIVNRLLLE